MNARCEVGVGCEDGIVLPCGEEAPYEARYWRQGPRNGDVPCCEHHALYALDSDAHVIGPYGHPCTIDNDGELVEVMQ